MIWCMKSENKCKRKGIKVLSALGGKNCAKTNGGKWQKIGLEPWPSHIEREKVEKLLKKWVWTRENQFFIKILYTIFDQSKNRFDQSKMLQ